MSDRKLYFGICGFIGALLFAVPSLAEELAVRQVKEDYKIVPMKEEPIEAAPAPSASPLVAWAATPAPTANESYGEWTPEEETLRRAKLEEVRQMNAASDRQRQEAETRQRAYEKQSQFEEDMTRHQKHIQEYKFKETQALKTIDSMQREMAEIESQQKEMATQLESVEQRHAYEMKNHTAAAEKLTETKNKLQKSVADLDRHRVATERKINLAQIEMQKFRSEIMQSETSISRIRNDKAHLDSDEIRVRTELADLGERSLQLQSEKNRMKSELDEQQRHFGFVKREYQQARKDADEQEKEVRELAKKQARDNAFTLAEIKRLEESTAMANNQRIRSEAERVRLAAETDKLKESLIVANQMNQEAKTAALDLEGITMETRLSYETTRAELASVNAATDKTKVDADTRRTQARQLASVVESSDMLEGQAPAEVVQNCRLRSQPSFKAPVVTEVKVGNRVIASLDSNDDWVKVLNNSGSPQFIRKSCLKY